MSMSGKDWKYNIDYWHLEVPRVGSGYVDRYLGEYEWEVYIDGSGGPYPGLEGPLSTFRPMFEGKETTLRKAKSQVEELLGLVDEYE